MSPLIILCLLPLLEATSGLENVTVKSGEDVTLPCQSDVTITAAEWTRDDLKPPEYVLLNIDGHLDPTHQHQSFKGRVQLADSELKTGNVSLTLKNVSFNDSGTYECRVAAGASRRQKRANIESPPIKTLRLEVTGSKYIKSNDDPKNDDPENGSFPHGHVGEAAGVAVAVIVLVVFVFVALKFKKASHKRSEPAVAEAGGDQLL